jgi:hypothetical protein
MMAAAALVLAVVAGLALLPRDEAGQENPPSSKGPELRQLKPALQPVLQRSTLRHLLQAEARYSSQQGDVATQQRVNSVEEETLIQSGEPRAELHGTPFRSGPHWNPGGWGWTLSRPPEEHGADGLPVNALRCTTDGGVLRCGECQTDSDCPAGKGCAANWQTHRLECMESECEQDLDCFPGLVCRPVTTGAAGPVIRRCLAAGERSLGEQCDLLFTSRAGACQEGLVCHRGVCSTPCSSEGAANCPEGYSCEEGLSGAACFEDCRVRGCASGQQCKRINETEYQCLEGVYGQCPETPCGEGERCNARVSQGQGVFWCAQLCNPLQADSCPKGQICGVGSPTVSTCFRRCDPRVMPDTCGEGWQCTSVTEDMTQFGCRPVAEPVSASSISSSASP